MRAGEELPNADAMAVGGRVGALGVGALRRARKGALRRAQLEHHVLAAAR